MSLSPLYSCAQLFVTLDFIILVYSNPRTWHFSVTDLHVRACVQPDIKVQNAHRWTLEQKVAQSSSINSNNYNIR